MKELLNNRVFWLTRIFFIFTSFFIFQSSIVVGFPYQTEYNFVAQGLENSTFTKSDYTNVTTGRHFQNLLISFSEASEPENACFKGDEDIATTGGTNTVTKSKSVLGHIFRDAPGHVNPSSIASQNRYITLFEKVANSSTNLNPNVLTNYQRTAGGFSGYSQIFRNGEQVWGQTFNGKIINAGVNIIPK